jgi:ABC-type glycerol-3-phosphate transport system substrate-binding protein
MKSSRIGIIVAAAVVLGVGASSAAGSTRSKVTISVASLIPGSTQAAINQFNAQVKEFEHKYPTIKVKPVEYQWTAPTFAAKLAAGTLPTVFEVPFTDARTLGDHGQLANLTPYFKKLPYHKKYNKAVLAEGTDAKGQVIALPKGAYAQALHYNRALFKQAGLNPNKPPTTWGQIRKDARIITQKTGKPGYVEMAKNDNTAGWILTSVVYSLGGRMEKGTGTHAKATLNNKYTVQALNMLKAMRWTDNSMGSNFDLGWSDINQAFAAGQVGMYISGSDVYTNLVQAYSVNPSIYGLTTVPLAKNKKAGVLGGGTLAAVRPKVSKTTLAAAMKWISFFYESPLVSKKQAIRNAKTLVANHQPVGVPALPLFNKKQYNLANKWIKPYINVPLGHMRPFLNGIFKQNLIPEPEASTQSVYNALNAVVEAVLTNQGTNIGQMLQQANAQAQAAIKAGS